MSGYDRWLTTDTNYEAQQALADAEIEAWEHFAQERNLPVEIAEDDHVDHSIYKAWYELMTALDRRQFRLEDEAEAFLYEQDEEMANLDAIEGDGGIVTP